MLAPTHCPRCTAEADGRPDLSLDSDAEDSWERGELALSDLEERVCSSDHAPTGLVEQSWRARDLARELVDAIEDDAWRTPRGRTQVQDLARRVMEALDCAEAHAGDWGLPW